MRVSDYGRVGVGVREGGWVGCVYVCTCVHCTRLVCVFFGLCRSGCFVVKAGVPATPSHKRLIGWKNAKCRQTEAKGLQTMLRAHFGKQIWVFRFFGSGVGGQQMAKGMRGLQPKGQVPMQAWPKVTRSQIIPEKSDQKRDLEHFWPK